MLLGFVQRTALHRFFIIFPASDVSDAQQLLDGADADRLDAVVRHPDGNGRAPVAAAAEGPVARVAQPVGEALLLDVLRHPVPARHHRVTPSQIHYN